MRAGLVLNIEIYAMLLRETVKLGLLSAVDIGIVLCDLKDGVQVVKRWQFKCHDCNVLKLKKPSTP